MASTFLVCILLGISPASDCSLPNYNQTPGKYPKEYIQYSKHGESLKSKKHFPCLKTKITPSVCVAMFAAMNHHVTYVCSLFGAYFQDGVSYMRNHRARQIEFRFILSCWRFHSSVVPLLFMWHCFESWLMNICKYQIS